MTNAKMDRFTEARLRMREFAADLDALLPHLGTTINASVEPTFKLALERFEQAAKDYADALAQLNPPAVTT
jgi:hypothetical protein